MAVTDLWVRTDGTPSARHGRGLRYRVTVPGHPSRAFAQKGQAQRYELRLLHEPPPQASDVTVGELLTVWLAGKARLAASTRRRYATTALSVRGRWEHIRVGAVTEQDVLIWLPTLGGSSTQTKALQCLSGVLRLAVRTGALPANPVAEIRLRPVSRRAPRYLSVGELRALVGAAGDGGSLLLFLGTTGLRIGEALALSVRDVDVDRGRVMVRRSKTGRSREVPVAASVLAGLDLGRAGDAPLFTSPRGRAVLYHNFKRRVFEPAVEAAKLGDLVPHDLRHTAASLAIASGADVKAVQRMLGHQSAVMTLDLYGHLWDRGLDDVAARLDGMLGLPGKGGGESPSQSGEDSVPGKVTEGSRAPLHGSQCGGSSGV